MPKSNTPKLQVTGSDLDLLVNLAECRFLTTAQMAALLNRNDKALSRRLRALKTGDIVRSTRQSSRGIPGSPPHVWCIGEAGLAHLKAGGRAQKDAAFDLFAARQIDCVGHELLVSEFRVQSAQLPAVVPALASRFLTSRSWALQTPGTHPAPRLYEPADPETQGTTEFVPDGVLLLRHAERGKALLFFLEVDMGTEPLRSPRSGVDLDTKIRNYRHFFAAGKYRRYEALAGSPLKGFRLLVVCGNTARLARLLPLARRSGPCDFVWATDCDRMIRAGIWGPIWHKASHDGPQSESILGGIAPASSPRPEHVAVPAQATR